MATKTEVALGIDIGTTKTAAVLVDSHGLVLAHASAPHNAALVSADLHAEQDPLRLLDSAADMVQTLALPLRNSVSCVGVTGQMHGVVVVDDTLRPLTPLVTWQDRRVLADPEFLATISKRTGAVLHAGYGCATLAWLAQKARMPAGSSSAGTIHDLLVASMCGTRRIVTDPANASSWGMYDIVRQDWDLAGASAAGIFASVLPQVVASGSIAGTLCPDWAGRLGVKAGTAVCAATGDNQASLISTLSDPHHQIALTLGTGGQLSVVAPRMERATLSTFEWRPFPGGEFLAVAASLCGGSAWAWLANRVTQWSAELGMPAPDPSSLYQRLNDLGLSARDSVVVKPHLLGERYDPALRASLHGFGPDTPSLGELARATARGIMESFRSRIPDQLLAGRTRLIASGNALRRNPLLQVMAREVFALPLEMPEGCEEAATGAAMLALRSTNP